ncbi:predicted protein [Pyrenophora tritici-repentis Pt-1C-BFP]|uniref:Uncharacterized protein n=1 Tax=Pyrenophora tritici-repentis (strain Pt-1C-BFP) TaxID=426418 RepID=B2WMS8_PYRTR|nr:uncharacterized protein PTRG_11288 [Pyrenophora tritici-repentis Pt-1C-BFP]EDU44338.1 predicted protein [Pyrenophora tritici-repentis Pt-1C-BFP]
MVHQAEKPKAHLLHNGVGLQRSPGLIAETMRSDVHETLIAVLSVRSPCTAIQE